jgi:polysaccharide export outer membrane protein
MFRFAVKTYIFATTIVCFFGCAPLTTTSVEPKVFMEIHENAPLTARVLVEGDAIELSVEVDGTMEVSFYRTALNYQGSVTLPLVGDVKIDGLKLEEAREIIGLAYSGYYVNPPVVMISLVNDEEITEWGYITVLGRVGRPGRVALGSSAGINLSEAIQQAGGFSASAKSSEIRVTRVDLDGKKLQTTINFEQIGLHGNASADIQLVDGDIVFVPERLF